MIRFAEDRDLPFLKALWAEAFGDSDKEIDLYFSIRHENENMLVDERDGMLAGMMSMLPITLCCGSENALPARYLYAVATDARYQGQGISTALLKAAHAHMKTSGDAACVLVPALPSLFQFYEKREYTPAFSLDIQTIHANVLPPFPVRGKLSGCTAKEYAELRNNAYHSSALYVCWDEAAVSYTIQSLSPEGGAIRLSWDGGYGAAVWERTPDGVLIRELALTAGDVYTALSVLHHEIGAAQYTVRLQQGTFANTISQPFGMIHWFIPPPAFSGAPPYLSLAMD